MDNQTSIYKQRKISSTPDKNRTEIYVRCILLQIRFIYKKVRWQLLIAKVYTIAPQVVEANNIFLLISFYVTIYSLSCPGENHEYSCKGFYSFPLFFTHTIYYKCFTTGNPWLIEHILDAYIHWLCLASIYCIRQHILTINCVKCV